MKIKQNKEQILRNQFNESIKSMNWQNETPEAIESLFQELMKLRSLLHTEDFDEIDEDCR